MTYRLIVVWMCGVCLSHNQRHGSGARRGGIHPTRFTKWLQHGERSHAIWGQFGLPRSHLQCAFLATYCWRRSYCLLTRAELRARGIDCETDCAVCDGRGEESVVHLIFVCPYARSVWDYFQRRLGKRILVQGPVPNPLRYETVFQIWEDSWREEGARSGLSKKEWTVWMLCGSWWIWRQRNNLIF